MMVIRYVAAFAVVFVSMLNVAPAAAQDARDPTKEPPETGAGSQSPTGAEGMTVVVRNNRPYLVVGTRLYAPGDKVGNLRVQRISETEVWFYDGTALTKVPRFAGITRKVIATKPPCTAPANSPAPAVAPCEDGQP
ncbi:MAG: hypothetical protein ABIZ09_16340 [Rhodoferax sp.]